MTISGLSCHTNTFYAPEIHLSTPRKKEEIVKRLKKQYDKVIMVGDGINDRLAMRAADLGVLSIQQTGKCPKLLCEEADVVIRDILRKQGKKLEILCFEQKDNFTQNCGAALHRWRLSPSVTYSLLKSDRHWRGGS
ncbi:MAG: HAD family hydrolase [Candidatus Methanoperedens sp.]|nr:HAD family hydrolase [Candidatus Methanoperedens sp.]